jgi:hypothetical protein
MANAVAADVVADVVADDLVCENENDAGRTSAKRMLVIERSCRCHDMEDVDKSQKAVVGADE